MPTTHRVVTIDEVRPGDYTAAQLVADLRAICAEAPHNTNPWEGYGDCVYQADDGARCLIGEWLTRRGHIYASRWEGTSADAVLDRLGYRDDVCSAAATWQTFADEEGTPWGTIPDHVDATTRRVLDVGAAR